MIYCIVHTSHYVRIQSKYFAVQFSFHFPEGRGFSIIQGISSFKKFIREKSVEEKLRRSHSHTKRCIVALNFHNDVSNGKTVDEEDDADRSV